MTSMFSLRTLAAFGAAVLLVIVLVASGVLAGASTPIRPTRQQLETKTLNLGGQLRQYPEYPSRGSAGDNAGDVLCFKDCD